MTGLVEFSCVLCHLVLCYLLSSGAEFSSVSGAELSGVLHHLVLLFPCPLRHLAAALQLAGHSGRRWNQQHKGVMMREGGDWALSARLKTPSSTRPWRGIRQ